MLDSSNAQKTKAHLLSPNRIFLHAGEESTSREVTCVEFFATLGPPIMKTSTEFTPKFNQMPTENYNGQCDGTKSQTT